VAGSARTGPGWSDIAGWYDALIESGSGPHETAVATTIRLAGDLTGLDVIDVACGQGLAARALGAAGARSVTGTDSSPAMLALARAHERTHPLGVRYVEDDARTLATLADDCADGVTCQLALMDIPDLKPALAAMRRVLRPGGWLVFVIGHPCFLTPEATTTHDAAGRPARVVNRYFDEVFWRSSNPQGVRRAGNHHRPLSTYLNTLIGAGFAIESVDEPRPSPRLGTQQPEYLQVPLLWATRARARP
jgi:ubiquinone/menaquinone biosynthesis C-methylase UbiE